MSKKNKKQPEYNREERERIVAHVTKDMMRKDLLPTAPTELEVLRERQNKAIQNVVGIMRPIFDMAKMADAKSPLSAHNPLGRNQLYTTAIKFALEEVKSFSKEELAFLLSLEYGIKVVETEF